MTLVFQLQFVTEALFYGHVCVKHTLPCYTYTHTQCSPTNPEQRGPDATSPLSTGPAEAGPEPLDPVARPECKGQKWRAPPPA